MAGGRTVLITAVAFSTVLGVAVGLGLYTFVYAKGASYLTNDPAACANCHIMSDHHASWIKSSHRHVAVCNDCHTPHWPLSKYATNASNGFWHSFAFTSGEFREPLRIKPANRRVTEAQCRRCHEAIVAAMDGGHPSARKLECLRCHGRVGHL